MSGYITSITGAIGGTPLLRLDRIAAHLGLTGHIFAKLDHLNPGFSKKDRIALGMIEMAERSGALRPGQTVVEMTSGNTGIGLAMVCAAKGYPFICVMSRGNSAERVTMVRAFGGDVHLVDQAPGAVTGQVSEADLSRVEAEALRVVAETGAFYVNQFGNDDNATSQEAAALEMWAQSGGTIQVFADFIGTGGTFAGYARALKREDPLIRCYAVEPHGVGYYGGDIIEGTTHAIQGGGYGKPVPFLDPALIDGTIPVTSEEATELAQLLARLEGVFAGYSSGANLWAAIQLLNGREQGQNIGIVINDCGLKYMSCDLF